MNDFKQGAEAGGILGVNTPPPPLFWAYNPHFLEGLKNGSWREAQQKLGELENNLGGKKILGGGEIFRRAKKFLGGRKNGGLSKKKGHQKI